MAKVPVAEQVQVNFRMPVGLRDRIKAEAEANNRSMNAEIIASLEQLYPSSPPSTEEVTVEVLQLLGVLTIMTDRERKKVVAEKQEELRKRGVSCTLELDGNIVRLLMAGGAIKYEVSLQDAPPDDHDDIDFTRDKNFGENI